MNRYGISIFASMLVCGLSAESPVCAADRQPTYTLNQIIQLALDRNPVMAGAQAVVDQNSGERVAAGAYPNPTFNGNGGRGYLRDAGPLTSEIPTSTTEYIFNIGQPFEWPQKRAARQRAAEAGLAGASVGLVETRVNLTSEVKIAFYDLLLAQRNAEIAKQNLQIVEDVRRIVGVRVRLGEAPQFEAVKADVEVLKANQVVTRADNTVRVNRVVLDTLTAGALGSTYTIEGEFEPFRKDLPVGTLVTRALTEHPTLKRLTNLVDQADRTIEFQRHSRVPNVTVNSTYVREYGREAFDVGVSVPAPLWYQRQGEIASALGNKRREEAELLRTRNLLLKEINQYYQDALTTADLIEVFEKGLLRQAQEALRIAQFSFKQGASSLLEVLDAQRVLRGILSDYVQARFELSVAVSRLERAVGGPLSTF